MVQLIVLLAAVSLPPIGEPMSVEGRIEQIDQEQSGFRDIWIRAAGDQLVLVRGHEQVEECIVGDRVHAACTRGEDSVQIARDGRTRRYTFLQAEGPLLRMSSAPFPVWMLALLAGLLAVFLMLAIMFGRRPIRPRPARVMGVENELEADWLAVEPSDLPADPADALAELARRADEEQE